MEPTVLILEADPAIRRLVRHGLARLGVAAREADAGPAAVAALADGSWAVRAIVVGELVPGLDGVALANALTRVRPGAGLFFFCGHSVDSELFDVPGVHVFLKPHDLRDLCSAIAWRCQTAAGQLATAPTSWLVAGASSSSGRV
jgi:DNA-binding NtrC family response regulator